MTHQPPSPEVTISDITDRLALRFPAIPVETIRAEVTRAHEDFEDARVRDFVEVLVEKQAKKRLKRLEP